MIYHLSIVNWGGLHYYCKILNPKDVDFRVILKYTITDPEELVRVYHRQQYKYSLGQEVENFPTQDAGKEAGKKWFADNAQPGDILLRMGWSSNAVARDPEEIIAGPLPVMEKGNELWKNALSIGYWENVAKMTPIARQWEALLYGSPEPQRPAKASDSNPRRKVVRTRNSRLRKDNSSNRKSKTATRRKQQP